MSACFTKVLSVTTARTVAVGGCGVAAQRLMDVTERALYVGIAAAVPGNRVTDISRAVQDYVEGNGYSVVREFVGHGVGRDDARRAADTEFCGSRRWTTSCARA